MKIVLATGGSGGHIFPALCTAHGLKDLGHEVIFVGVLGNFGEKIRKEGFEVLPLEAKGLTFVSLQKFSAAVVEMFKALARSLKILKHTRPDVVCGFGGYGAFALVGAAVLLRIPTIIHEQNVVPGKANRLLSLLVSRIAATFRESEKYLDRSKMVVTGCPCREKTAAQSREALRREFHLGENTLTILILGGSQGSRRVNEAFLAAAQLLKKERDFQCIHLTGKAEYLAVQEKYSQLNIHARVFDFFDDMQKAYLAADLVISRAGAVTVCEIAKFGLPSILVPYPYAGGHQKENAKVLSDAGAAALIDENDLTADVLKAAILNAVQQKNSFAQRQERLQDKFFPDAVARLSHEIVSLKK